MGGIIQSILPLIDWKDQDGDTVPGCLQIPVVVKMCGEDSFDHPSVSPWKTLLSAARLLLNLKNRLQFIWLHVTLLFQAVATALETSDKNLLLSQSVHRAGFDTDGSHASLVSNTLTLEKEMLVMLLGGGRYQQH
jgi:hypothetical protein